MILIKVLKYWTRGDEPPNFPAITINSISSNLMLNVSSSSGIVEKCLFAFTMILLNLKNIVSLHSISLETVFNANVHTILYFLGRVCIFSLFYLKYTRTFVKKVEELQNELKIEFDYETRKYFWTRKVIYYSFNVGSKICLLINTMGNAYHKWPYSDLERRDEVDYWIMVIRVLIIYPFFTCQDCILYDLAITARAAIEYFETQSKRIYKESLKDEKALNFQAIHDLRLKYLQTHRLVNKINEFMSPCLLVSLIIYVNHFINAVYQTLFVQQSRSEQMYRLSSSVGAFTLTITFVHLAAQVYQQSQQLLMTVYRLSLKTDHLKVLNEISLFVNCNEIGFSLGGICMITSSTITTTLSILVTLIIAIPSFAN
uniref:Gustatory receptor n=1 Tax=Tetranychus urticae TaxID=32264 RepID=T1KIK2_TETUR